MWKEISQLPIISNKQITELDAYFNLVKNLSREEHAIWRMYKKSMWLINSNFEKGIFSEAEIPAWYALGAIADKMPFIIRVNLIL